MCKVNKFPNIFGKNLQLRDELIGLDDRQVIDSEHGAIGKIVAEAKCPFVLKFRRPKVCFIVE